jgi:hypothetical protein
LKLIKITTNSNLHQLEANGIFSSLEPEPKRQKVAMGELVPMSGDPNDLLHYKLKNGEYRKFDASKEACAPFGFFSSQRVVTPKGEATVVGVAHGYLWFHVDGDAGAIYFDTCRTYEDLIQEGIYSVDPPAKSPNVYQELQLGEYKIKRVEYNGKNVNILLQNENGPCPLIAIANILALRGDIFITGENDRISVDQMCKMLTTFIKSKPGQTEELQKTVESVSKSMPELQYGLDVDCGFTRCDSFTKTEKSKIFDLLDIKMLHGWLVDPADAQLTALIGESTYEELTLRIVASSEVPSEDSNKGDEAKRFSVEEAVLVQNFLDTTAHQLTDYGLQQLHSTLREGELAVFFRNNHFSTLTKHGGVLFNLVTDIGYERERNVVWDLLSEVMGNSQLFNSTFQTMEEVKRDEVINTALAFGFTKIQVDEAVRAISKPDEELDIDKLLEWLQKKYPIMQ